MKIAFLITAYGSADNVNRFIKQVISYNESYIFIHVDKKSKLNKEDIYKHDRVFIMKTEDSFSVDWGDFSQIQSVSELMRFAKTHGQFDYYSLHSESDLLVRPIKELISFLSDDNAFAYMWCYELPYEKWQYDGGLGRIALYWPKCFRKKCSWLSPFRIMRSLYGKMYGAHLIKGKKLPNNIRFWGKCDWFTVSRACVDSILDVYDNNSEFNSLFVNSLIGSEIYFTTIAHMHDSEFRVVSDNDLRYIDFKQVDYKHPGSPKVIGMEDIEKIKESRAFFARKFDSSIDKDVIDYYLKNNKI